MNGFEVGIFLGIMFTVVILYFISGRAHIDRERRKNYEVRDAERENTY